MLIKETLINKIASLEEDSRFKLHSRAKSTMLLPSRNFVWSHDDNGYFLQSPMRGVYLSNTTGLVHRARVVDNESSPLELEHKKHKLLYEISNVRMDIPIHFEYVSMFNKTWAYSIIERPNKQLGVGFQVEFTLSGKNPTSFFKDAIVEHKKLLIALPKVINELGEGLPKYCQPAKYLRDDIGLFATGFKSWADPADTFMQKQYAKIADRLNEWNVLVKPDMQVDIESMLDFATNMWGDIDGYK